MTMKDDKRIQEVYRAMKKAKEVRMYRRYQAIYLRLTGVKLLDIARIVGVTKKTIDNYWAAYRHGGLAALVPEKQTGAPKKLTEQQEKDLLNVIITKTPVDVGFPTTYNWTAKIVGEYVQKEYGVSYSIRGMTKVLHRLGLSFTRPTYTLKKADPEKQEEFKKEFDALKKN